MQSKKSRQSDGKTVVIKISSETHKKLLDIANNYGVDFDSLIRDCLMGYIGDYEKHGE